MILEYDNLEIFAVTTRSFVFTLVEKKNGNLNFKNVNIILPSKKSVELFYINSDCYADDEKRKYAEDLSREQETALGIWAEAQKINHFNLTVRYVDIFPVHYYAILDQSRALLGAFAFEKGKGSYGMSTSYAYTTSSREVVEYCSSLYKNTVKLSS